MGEKVYLIFWMNQNEKRVLEVWDDYDKAVERRDKYFEVIKNRSYFKKWRAALNSYKETVYIKEFIINERQEDRNDD
jgi:hypothetical protein